MSYIDQLRDMERDGPQSVTQRIVDAIAGAIEAGELAAGARLPPTRELAEIAGVNHLTAVRAYRRLRDLGLVQPRVGSGTYVREPRARVAAPPLEGGSPAQPPAGELTDWQRYVLPEVPDSDALDRAHQLTMRGDDDLIQMALAYPPTEMLPARAWAAHTAFVLEELGSEALQYAPVEGVRALREQAARLAGDWERPEDLVVVSGTTQGITIVTRTLVSPGTVVACESPTSPGILDALRAASARVYGVPVDERGLDVEALERLVTRQEVRLVVVQSRNQNPTGAELAPERAERLVALARRHGFFVLDDEVWGGLRFDGAPRKPLREWGPDHVIAAGSMSKVAGGGLRMGWLRASGPVVDQLVHGKRIDDIHSPALLQLAAARYIASGEYADQLETARSQYHKRWEACRAAAARHLDGLACLTDPLGGASAWVTLVRPVDEDRLMAETTRAGVTVIPGSAFAPERPAATQLRLAFSFPPIERIDEGVRRVAQAIKAVATPQREAVTWPVA
jgi:2-aminoadipate transaminase